MACVFCVICVPSLKTYNLKIKMKTTKILISICVALIMVATNLQSQVVIGKDKTPHTGSVLEVNNNSTNKGILLPKVSLTATGTWGLAGTDAAEKGMVVFNTNKTISGTGANGEGLYYWNGVKWMWMAQDTLISVTPAGGIDIRTIGNAPALKIINNNQGQQADDVNITTYSGSGSADPYLAFARARGTEATPIPVQKGDLIGSIAFNPYIKAGFTGGSNIAAYYVGNGTTNRTNLEFRTSASYGYMVLDSIGRLGVGALTPTEKLHIVGNAYATGNIYAGGNIGIGTTTPAYGLHLALGKNMLLGNKPSSGVIYSGTASNDGLYLENQTTQSIWLQRSDANANILLSKNKTLAGGSVNNYSLMQFSVGTTGSTSSSIGNIKINATGDGVVYNTTSDKRLKENITNTHYSLSDLMKISVKDYNFKSDETKTVQTGFLAQDLYEVYPEAVSVGGENAEENPWGVDYGKVTPLLVKAIQDQQKIIEQLENRIKTLENK